MAFAVNISRIDKGDSKLQGLLNCRDGIPIVHFSVVWWRTLHQPPSLIRPDGPQIQDPLMLVALFVGVLAFTVVYVSLIVKLVELSKLDDRVREAEGRSERPVAGEAVTAPTLGGEG